MPELLVTADLAALAAEAAEQIGQAIRDSVAQRDGCSLALTGGATARPVYVQLARRSGIPWEAVGIYFGDERGVPPEHPDSNYRLAQETLLSRVAVPLTRIHRMEAERDDREAAAGDYAALLPNPLDVLLLGMGADGHTASLFPHAETLAEERRRVVPALGGVPLLPRLTITPPVIAAAKRLFMMVSGAEKAISVRRALEDPPNPAELPAQLARHGTWILDRPAAEALRSVSR